MSQERDAAGRDAEATQEAAESKTPPPEPRRSESGVMTNPPPKDKPPRPVTGVSEVKK